MSPVSKVEKQFINNEDTQPESSGNIVSLLRKYIDTQTSIRVCYMYVYVCQGLRSKHGKEQKACLLFIL